MAGAVEDLEERGGELLGALASGTLDREQARTLRQLAVDVSGAVAVSMSDSPNYDRDRPLRACDACRTAVATGCLCHQTLTWPPNSCRGVPSAPHFGAAQRGVCMRWWCIGDDCKQWPAQRSIKAQTQCKRSGCRRGSDRRGAVGGRRHVPAGCPGQRRRPARLQQPRCATDRLHEHPETCGWCTSRMQNAGRPRASRS